MIEHLWQRDDLMHRLGQLRLPITPSCLELQLHLPGGEELHALNSERRPDDAATQLFQQLAVVCFDPHRGVQAETDDVGAPGLARCALARYPAPEGKHLLP